MEIICTHSLTARQAEQLAQLTELCRSAEPLTLSCPADGDLFLLLTEGEQILSVLAAYFHEHIWECRAFTRPDCRRKGYFSRLLERLEEEALASEPELCFITDGRSPAALIALEAVGAEFWYAEHAMVWRAADGKSGRTGAAAGGAPRPIDLEIVPCPSSPAVSRLTARSPAGGQVGTCGIYTQGDTACLFELEVPAALRGQGLGTAVVRTLLDRLPAMGISTLTLQVSGGNTPAMSLYAKTGFRITETLSYYLY